MTQIVSGVGEARMIVVRTMKPGDIPGAVGLFQAMQAHYGVSCPPGETIAARLADPPAGVTLLVAVDPAPLGFAAVCAVFPGPDIEAGLFLKELFVRAEARGRGIGGALMRAVAGLAVERGFARVDWTADRSDGRLLRFYDATGATQQHEKVFFRLTGDALARFAAGPNDPG